MIHGVRHGDRTGAAALNESIKEGLAWRGAGVCLERGVSTGAASPAQGRGHQGQSGVWGQEAQGVFGEDPQGLWLSLVERSDMM